MSKPVIISSDSTCDLSPELRSRYQIQIVPLTITLGESSFLDGESFTPDDMYARFRKDGTLPKTSAPSVQNFLDFFQSYVDQGYEIVHFDISAELSGSYNAARLAADELTGVSAFDIAVHVSDLRQKVSTSFVLDTLEFMWKGGRCTGVTAFGANLLKIKPGLEMRAGKLEVYKKYRGKIEHVYRQYITERLSGKKIRPGHIFITESGEVDPAVLADLEALVKDLSGCEEVHHTVAGCTVSSHCGPKTLGVLFIEQ